MNKIAELHELQKGLAEEYIVKRAAIEEAIIKEAANNVVLNELAKLANGNEDLFVQYVKEADADSDLYLKVLDRALNKTAEAKEDMKEDKKEEKAEEDKKEEKKEELKEEEKKEDKEEKKEEEMTDKEAAIKEAAVAEILAALKGLAGKTKSLPKNIASVAKKAPEERALDLQALLTRSGTQGAETLKDIGKGAALPAAGLGAAGAAAAAMPESEPTLTEDPVAYLKGLLGQ